jgi:hypothetical protein
MVRQCAVDEKYLHIILRAEAGAVKPIVDAVDALSLLMMTQAAKYTWSPISSRYSHLQRAKIADSVSISTALVTSLPA